MTWLPLLIVIIIMFVAQGKFTNEPEKHYELSHTSRMQWRMSQTEFNQLKNEMKHYPAELYPEPRYGDEVAIDMHSSETPRHVAISIIDTFARHGLHYKKWWVDQWDNIHIVV